MELQINNPATDYKAPDGEAPKTKDTYSYEGESFVLEDDGVYLIPKDKLPKKVCGWLKVTARTIDEKTNEEGFIVNLKNGSGKLRELNFSRRALAASNTALNEELEGQGLQIFSEGSKRNSSALIRYLKAVVYDGRIPERRVIPRAGWAGEDYKTFLFTNRCISIENESERPLLSKDAPPMLSEANGTLEEWKTNIRKISDYSARLRFGLYVSLASVLVPMMTKGGNSLFHFIGESGCGKSTILHAAWSVWGRALSIYKFKASKNGLEELFSERNHILFAGDEVKQLTAEGIEDLAFTYGEGRGKARSDMGAGLKPVKEWRGYALTASEEDLQTMKAGKQKRGLVTTLEGEMIRFLQIPAVAGPWGVFDCFPEDLMPTKFSGAYVSEESEEQTKGGIPAALREKQNSYVTSAINALNEIAFGTAGPAFIEQIEHAIKDGGLEYLKATIKECMSIFKDGVKSSSRSQIRASQAFALVAAAGELAINFGILPYEAGKSLEDVRTIFHAWISSEGTPEQQTEGAIEIVRNASESSGGYRRFFWNGQPDSEQEFNEDAATHIIGAIEGTVIQYKDEVLCVIYQPKQFTKLVSGTGVERSRVIRGLLERGMLFKPYSDKCHYGQRQLKKSIHAAGLTKSWYFILLSGIYPDDSEEKRSEIIGAVDRLLRIGNDEG